MDELKLTGNHLKGSRPVLSFDAAFDEEPHLQVLKELLTHVFATPRRHHKSKPFFDHVLSFSWADGRVWFRNYQVCYWLGLEARACGWFCLVCSVSCCLLASFFASGKKPCRQRKTNTIHKTLP
jgi:hypothetical protein